jgi:3,4-dihydroxy 2-butanone 4-phosphate synthase/GTP cyclohydrolase II
VTYRDRLTRELHFALVRGEPGADDATLVRVHVKNPLSDLLHWQRADFGVGAHAAMARIAAEGSGVLVVLAEPVPPDELLARITGDGSEAAAPRVTEWRRTGAGAQILADLGLRQLRVLGTARRQVGLAGFGLEIVEHVPTGAGDTR